MNVVLITPGTMESFGPPLGVMSIASVLEEDGHNVRILDLTSEPIGHNIPSLLNSPPCIIGISSATTPALERAAETTRLIRTSCPDAFIVWGGVHPTLLPLEVIKELPIDAVCIGEGEQTICELARALENQDDVTNVKGLVLKKKGHIQDTGFRSMIEDLNALPMYAWHLIDIEKHVKMFCGKRCIDFVTSRGCPSSCTYCYTNVLFGRKWRGRSVDNVVRELFLLNQNYGIEAFEYFDDLPFGGSREMMLCFCDRLIESGAGFSWNCNYKITLVDEKLLQRMQEAGCRSIYFGIETGSPRLLREVCKDEIRIEELPAKVRLVCSVGIEPHVGLMFGLPGETQKDLADTYNLMKKLPATRFFVWNFKRYPGTRIFEDAVANGFVAPQGIEAWSRYSSYERTKKCISRVACSYTEKVRRKLQVREVANSLRFVLRNGQGLIGCWRFLSRLRLNMSKTRRSQKGSYR